MKKTLQFILFILIQYNCIKAQVSYNYKLYTTEDGLISNSCYKLFQDSKGYLWVANGNGVSKFNGKRFDNIIDKKYKKGNWQINQIIEDKSLKNQVLGNSSYFIYNLNSGQYISKDSALVEKYHKDRDATQYFSPFLDKDFYKIYRLNKGSKEALDTIYFSYFGKYSYVLLPNIKHNHELDLLLNSNNDVIIKSLDTLNKTYSYYSFEKGN